jgi:hypothetical protein
VTEPMQGIVPAKEVLSLAEELVEGIELPNGATLIGTWEVKDGTWEPNRGGTYAGYVYHGIVTVVWSRFITKHGMKEAYTLPPPVWG